MQNQLMATIMAMIIWLNQLSMPISQPMIKEQVIAKRSISLDKRYNNAYVNDVFKKNIMLTLFYLNGDVSDKTDINWQKVSEPYHVDVELKPDEVFAFHDGVLPQFKGKVRTTPGVHFNAYEGFLSDGYLVGDGVCHLASIINWAARDAGLDVVSPTNHNFAEIPEVPREYGVSIYSQPGIADGGAVQNLYVRNNKKKPVVMKFHYDGANLTVAVTHNEIS
jgi:hypothetical protein